MKEKVDVRITSSTQRNSSLKPHSTTNMHRLVVTLILSITTLGKANVLRREQSYNGKHVGNYDVNFDRQATNHATNQHIDHVGFLPGSEIRTGVKCGHFDLKDTTHLVSDPDHPGSFYFCVDGVSVGPMVCAQGTVFHPVYKVCSWPENPRQHGDPPHILS